MPKSYVFILVEYKKMVAAPFKSNNEVAYENIARLCEVDQRIHDLQQREHGKHAQESILIRHTVKHSLHRR